MQNVIQNFARHRSVGECVEMIFHALGVQNNGVDSKCFERFIKEEEISVNEYKEILSLSIENIIYSFESSPNINGNAKVDSKTSKDFKQRKQVLEQIRFFIHGFFEYYEMYKNNYATLGASQKQLDFIDIAVFFVPFASQFAGFIFSKFDAENLGFFIDRILPSLDSKDSILDKTFEIISNTMMDNKEILESINGDIKVLDSKDIIAVSLRKVLEVKSVGRINKNISNWLHNKNLPSIESINEISNIAKFSNEYSQIEIANMLKIARTTSILYNKSVEYFGREMSDVLVALFRVISVMEAQRIAFTQMLPDFDSGLDFFYYTIEEEYAKKLSFESHQYLLTILNGFFNASAYIPLLKKYVKQEHHKINANDIDKEYSEKLDYIFGNFISKSMVVIESSFFENIELFLPSRVFSLKENIKLDSKEYFKEALNAFMYQDSKNVPSFDKMAKNDRVNKEFENYYNALQEINILVLPDIPKENTDIEKYLDSIKNIESIYNNDPYIEFIKARFDIQNCEFESATEHYLNALKYGKNVIGINIKNVITEGLIAAAQCSRKDSIDMTSNKSNFVKFYTQGCLLGLIDDKPENISQHYLDDFKKEFSITFKHLFIESNFAESKPHISILDSKKAAKMKKLVDEKFITPNFIADVMKDSIYFDKKLDIDFDNPNKIIKQKDGAIRDESQLMYCACMEQVDNVKKLIQKGANVNYIRKYDNSTALLHMMTKEMMYARMSDKQIEIAKILIPLMSKEAINSRLNKRKETALSLAIYCGEVSLVEMLINNNADIESKIHTPDNLTALYYSLICINQAKNGINFKRLDSMYWDKDKQKRLVSSNPMFSSGIFKDDYTKAFELIMNMWRSQEYQEISKKIHNIILKPKLESYYRIFDILCQKPQDINIECVNGCSALLFACEINETTLAKKLLDKGANKYHKQKAGYTAYDYARGNYNIELMSLLK